LAWAAPLPFFPFDPVDVALYAVTNDTFFFEFDWAGHSDLFGSPMDDSSTDDDGGPLYPPFGTNDFWVEVVAATNGLCLVAAHGCTNHFCQLQLKGDLAQTNWILGEVVHNDPPTNRLFLTPVPMTNLALYYEDYATVAYSVAGVPLWTNRYDGSGSHNDHATAIAVDGNDNVFVTGYAYFSPLGFGDHYATIKYSPSTHPYLASRRIGNNLVLSWTNPSFSLQSAPAVSGSFTNVPLATSPFTNSAPNQFFRLTAP
jgi:hypothetical protein